MQVDGEHGAVGITDFAQQQLGDVVYVELPEVGATLTIGQAFGTIESVKAVSELFAPVSGTVTEVNTALKDRPDAVNSAPHDTWMIKVQLANPGRRRRAARRRRLRSAHALTRPVRLPQPGPYSMDTFVRRHVGPRPHDLPEMLATIGAPSLDALIDEAIPAAIRRPDAARAAAGRDRARVPDAARGHRPRRTACCARSSAWATTTRITPSVIRRCLFENPSWYTPYTPYQAEIAQGRLESLLNFQTVVTRPDRAGGRRRRRCSTRARRPARR